MKTGNKVKFSLKEYTNTLIASFNPVAIKQKTLLVNDIREDLHVSTDANILSTIISGLLSNVLGQCQNSCIRINVNTYNNVVLFKIRSNSGINAFHPLFGINESGSLARTIGGCVSLNNSTFSGTSIIFSFLRA